MASDRSDGALEDLTFAIDQDVDAYHAPTKSWLPARIITATKTSIRIYYIATSFRGTATISISNLQHLAPRGSKATVSWQTHDELQKQLVERLKQLRRQEVDKQIAKLRAQQEEIDRQIESLESESQQIEPPRTEVAVTPASSAENSFPFSVGQDVDVFCVLTRTWLAGRVAGESTDGLTVHYLGWSTDEDEFFSRKRLTRLAKRGSKVPGKWRIYDMQQEKLRQGSGEADIEPINPVISADQDKHGKSKGGKAVGDKSNGSRPETSKAASPGRNASQKRKSSDGHVNDSKTKVKKSSSPRSLQQYVRDYTNLCAVCGKLEDGQQTEMISCAGGCPARSHLGCLNLDASSKHHWKCILCKHNEQQCFICGDVGVINKEGGMFKCSEPECRHFYHQSCIDHSPMARRFANGKLLPLDATLDGERRQDEPFKCPRHECVGCKGSKGSDEFAHCRLCPTSYHAQCVPPKASDSPLGFMCPKHHASNLPKLSTFLNRPQLQSQV